MAYTKQTWRNSPDQTTPISAPRLNHLETQYDEATGYTDSKISALPSASTSVKGLVELATNTEAMTGTDTVRAVTPAGVKAVVDAIPGVTTDSRSVNPSSYGVPTDGTTPANAAFQTMLNNLPENSKVVAAPGQRFNFTGPVQLSKPVTIQGGEYVANRAGVTFVIDADDVTIDDIRITGPGASLGVVLAAYFITTTGTAARPIKRTRISNCIMTGTQSSFIWLEWISDFLIENNHLSDGQYAGIMTISPKQGVIRNNTVRTLRQDGTLVNSYGIGATDNDNTEAVRAENVLIDGNFVADVPGWKGIDTHGGRGIEAVNNRVVGCRTGISFTTGNATRLMAPQNCLISNNIIDLGSSPNQNAALVLNGKSGGPLATGTIGPNIITGYSTDLDLQNYDANKVTVSPQTHNGSVRRSPQQTPFRTFTASDVIAKEETASGGKKRITFPAGLFTTDPVVMVTKSSGTGARQIPFAENISPSGCDVSVYSPTGTGEGAANIPFSIIAMQATPSGTGASSL